MELSTFLWYLLIVIVLKYFFIYLYVWTVILELGPFPSGYRFPDFQNYSFVRVSCAAVPISYVYFILFLFVLNMLISYLLVSTVLLDIYMLYYLKKMCTISFVSLMKLKVEFLVHVMVSSNGIFLQGQDLGLLRMSLRWTLERYLINLTK